MTLKPNPKQDSILSAAKTLFWKFGIKKVSVEEICKEAQISKMTFYKFFKNKEILAEFLLNEFLTGWHNQYRTIMSEDISFAQKIKQIVLLEQSASKDMGDEFFKDIYNNEFVGLQKLFYLDRERYQTEFIRDFRLAQQNGEVRQDMKPEFILYVMQDIGNKVQDEKLSKLYSSKQDLIMELTNYFFYGILNREE